MAYFISAARTWRERLRTLASRPASGASATKRCRKVEGACLEPQIGALSRRGHFEIVRHKYHIAAFRPNCHRPAPSRTINILWSSRFTNSLSQRPYIFLLNRNGVEHGIKGFQQVWTSFTATQRHGGDLLLNARGDEQPTASQNCLQVLNESSFCFLPRWIKQFESTTQNGAHAWVVLLSNHHVCAATS